MAAAGVAANETDEIYYLSILATVLKNKNDVLGILINPRHAREAKHLSNSSS